MRAKIARELAKALEHIKGISIALLMNHN
jgi:hypothetical protein